MTIDAHQHFWRYDPVQDAWITGDMAALKRDFLPDDLMPELRKNGVDRCVAVQAAQSEEETLFLLDLAGRHDAIRGVVGWVDLRAGNVAERLEFFSRFPRLRGFRHIAQAERDDFLLDAEFQRGVAELHRFGLTYDILIYARQLPAAAALVERFPEQQFVLDHIAKPEIRNREVRRWEQGIRRLAACGNIHCKLSGLITEADWTHWRGDDLRPYLDIVFDAFGPGRLMFGSDWPVCLLAGTYAQVKQLVEEYVRACAPAAEADIFGGNASRFYGLAA